MNLPGKFCQVCAIWKRTKRREDLTVKQTRNKMAAKPTVPISYLKGSSLHLFLKIFLSFFFFFWDMSRSRLKCPSVLAVAYSTCHRTVPKSMLRSNKLKMAVRLGNDFENTGHALFLFSFLVFEQTEIHWRSWLKWLTSSISTLQYSTMAQTGK